MTTTVQPARSLSVPTSEQPTAREPKIDLTLPTPGAGQPNTPMTTTPSTTTPAERTPGTPPLDPPAAPQSAAPSAPSAMTAPDAQRAALRDLVALATESAATEARVERELQAALAAAAETFDKATKTIRYRSADQTAQATQAHEARLNEIAAQHAAAIQAIRQAERPARKRAEGEVEQAEQLVARKIQEAAWLADSDLEVALNTLAVEEKTLKAEVAGQVARLAAQEKDAVSRTTTFGYKPTPEELAAANATVPTEAIALTAFAPPLLRQAPPPLPNLPSALADAAAASDSLAVAEAIDAPTTPGLDGLMTGSPASASPAAAAVDPDPAGTFAARQAQVDKALHHLRGLALPRVFVGITPAFILILLAVISGGLGWYLGGMGEPNLPVVGGVVGGTLVVAIALGLTLRGRAKRQVREAFVETTAALAGARQAAAARLALAADTRAKAKSRAQHRKETETKYAKERYAPGLTNARKKADAALGQLAAQVAQSRQEADDARDAALLEAETGGRTTTARLGQQLDLDLKAAEMFRERQVGDARQRYDQAQNDLQSRLREGLATVEAPMAATRSAGNQAPQDWESPAWATWKPTKLFASAVRFGRLHVDLMKIARESAAAKPEPAAKAEPADDHGAHHHDSFSLMFPAGSAVHPAGNGKAGSPSPAESAEPARAVPPPEVRLALPPPFDLPATLAFPSRASMLVRADRDGRAEAVRTVQMAMARLLVSLPPGRVHFTLLDPVGLGQNFAGFMHLADHDDRLVGGRIWTETEQVDQRLNDLTGHMETIIQKYLRNEFATIDDYNAQAGELAEPYRVLVASDFPAGFTDEALRRLSSVATSGARCGVYTLIFNDTRLSLPHGVTTMEDLAANSVVLDVPSGVELPSADFRLPIERQATAASPTASAAQSAVGNRQSAILWRDPVFGQFPLAVDPPPSEDRLTKICDVVGRGAKDAARVEVPFETIAPPIGKLWSADSGKDIGVPVGRTGATRLQHVRLGKGVAQHVLIAGKTGSGKSTLLHALVTNLALWYGPDQVEFYLVDFKKGVEFKTYATYNLPHARAIAVESDREFGLSVLQRLDAELTRRGEMYRAVGVQDLAAYRRSPNPVEMPRTLLIVDEFQEFFSEDDKLAQESSVLLDRLVRQGRAFGIHVLLGSQTIAGSGGLPRSTVGQMAVRVALMTSEADSQLILGDNNSAARLLSRPGEAIYNDQGGLVEGNSPFQVAWLSDERKDAYLAQIRKRADELKVTATPPIVFEGNAPADLSKNARLAALLDGTETVPAGSPPRAWVGEPVAIKDATAIPLRRQSGANVLIIGQAEDAAMATMVAAMVSLAAQVPAGSVGSKRDPSGSASGPTGADGAGAVAAVAAPSAEAPKPATESFGDFSFDDDDDAPAASESPAAPAITTPRFYVLDATPADSPLYGSFAKLKAVLPHDVRVVEWRATGDAVNEIATELGRRRDGQDLAAAPIFVFVYGLQRYRILRKPEDEFGMSFGSGGGGDEPKPADPGKQFAEILKDGPSHGVHVVAWADTATAVDRTLDRGSLREFDTRVLFQMSANDSSNLVDSPAANKLGFHRALAYSEEQGVMEKFRPYGLPTEAFLARVRERLAER